MYGIQRQPSTVSSNYVSRLHCSVAGQSTGLSAAEHVLLDTTEFVVGTAIALGAAGAGLVTLQPGSLYQLLGWITAANFATTGRCDVRWALAESPFTALGTGGGVGNAPADTAFQGPALAFFDARPLTVPTVLELRLVTVSDPLDSLSAVALIAEL